MSHFGDSFNLSRALSSPSYAKTIWCNYDHWKKQGVSAEEIESKYGVSASDIGQIEAQWQSKLASWKESTALDDNKYIIDEDDESWDEAYNNGKKSAQKTTGYENTTGQKVGQYANNIANIASIAGRASANAIAKAAGSAIGKAGAKEAAAEAGRIAGEKASEEVLKKAGEDSVKEAAAAVAGRIAEEEASEEVLKKAGEDGAKKATAKVTKESAKEAGKKITNISILIASAFDVASAILYRVTNPNKKQHEVVEKLATDMDNQMSNTVSAQENLTSLDENNIALGDEANAEVEDANNIVTDTKTEYDYYADTLEYLESLKVQGHEFTKEELELYEVCTQYMIENAEEVEITQEEASNQINEIHDEMANSEAEYDAQAEAAANVEGVTDYAASIDKTQQISCYIEGGAQTLNASIAAIDAYKAGAAAVATGWCGGIGAVYGAAAIASAAAGVSDGEAAYRQFTWAKEAGDEITARESVQDTNAVTISEYGENIDNYALYMEDVEDLELLEPDNMEAPTGTESPMVSTTSSGSDSGTSSNESSTDTDTQAVAANTSQTSDNPNKKKEEEA